MTERCGSCNEWGDGPWYPYAGLLICAECHAVVLRHQIDDEPEEE
jgi:hypothetical protein